MLQQLHAFDQQSRFTSIDDYGLVSGHHVIIFANTVMIIVTVIIIVKAVRGVVLPEAAQLIRRSPAFWHHTTHHTTHYTTQ